MIDSINSNNENVCFLKWLHHGISTILYGSSVCPHAQCVCGFFIIKKNSHVFLLNKFGQSRWNCIQVYPFINNNFLVNENDEIKGREGLDRLPKLVIVK